MAKKTSKRKSVRTSIQPDRKTAAEPRDQGKDADERDEAGPFEFGGFPARDLKKNLGCG